MAALRYIALISHFLTYLYRVAIRSTCLEFHHNSYIIEGLVCIIIDTLTNRETGRLRYEQTRDLARLTQNI